MRDDRLDPGVVVVGGGFGAGEDYVLLNLEAYSLLIGSVLMFFALAGVMYMTRGIDWSGIGKKETVA